MSGERSGVPRFSRGRRGHGCPCKQPQKIEGKYLLIKCHPSSACKELRKPTIAAPHSGHPGTCPMAPGDGSIFRNRQENVVGASAMGCRWDAEIPKKHREKAWRHPRQCWEAPRALYLVSGSGHSGCVYAICEYIRV